MGQKAQESNTQWENQREDLLIAIDQLSQMTEVMNDVLTRVKQQVDTLDNTHQKNQNTNIGGDKGTPSPSKKTKNNNNRLNKKFDLVH
jgi:hypothetical protein